MSQRGGTVFQTDESLKMSQPARNAAQELSLTRYKVRGLRAGWRQPPGSWASALFERTGGLTPNGTDFTSVTRSVSEGNKGKRLMSSPSLTLRVSKVSAIGLTPPRSEASSLTARGINPYEGRVDRQRIHHVGLVLAVSTA